MKKKLSQKQIQQFQKKVYDHYDKNQRDFPWRKAITPYKIVVSEIMLQQTQAPRVVEKFKLFIKTFPTFTSLAQAELKEILGVWQGLGYNRRALGLKKLAEIVVRDYHGKLPQTPEELECLPWIGPHTAGSIAAFAYNYPSVFIETNIRSVYIHEFFGDTIEVSDKELLPYIAATLDTHNPRIWYNALMDYGVMIKETHKNPSRKSKHYTKQSAFHGSKRKLRGHILALLTHSLTPIQLSQLYTQDWGYTDVEIDTVLATLESERLITHTSRGYTIA